MSLLIEVLSKWRDPAISAQRRWVFTLLWGRTVNQRMLWFLAYVFLLCCLWLISVKMMAVIYLPLAFFAFLPATNTAFVVSALSRWRIRSPYFPVIIAQASLLYWLVWSLLGWLLWFRTANPSSLILMSFVLLLGQYMAYSMPDVFARNKFESAQGQTWQLQLMWLSIFIPILLLFLYPQYERVISLGLLLLSLGLLIALFSQIKRFGTPQLMRQNDLVLRKEKCIARPKSILKLRLEMNMGFALDSKGWRKFLGNVLLMPYGMIFVYQHFLPIPGVNQWGAGAIFAMQTAAFFAYFTGRRQWSNAWLNRTNSRARLWWQDEQIFVGSLLLIAVINCGLLLLLRIDNASQILNAALLFVAGMACLRYSVLSLPWMNCFGLNANGRIDQQGFAFTFILFMPIWVVLAWIWGAGKQDQIELMILSLAVPVPILAYFSYRYALKINLAAIRRAKRS